MSGRISPSALTRTPRVIYAGIIFEKAPEAYGNERRIKKESGIGQPETARRYLHKWGFLDSLSAEFLIGKNSDRYQRAKQTLETEARKEYGKIYG